MFRRASAADLCVIMETQSEVIREQQEIIDRLFLLLLQHITVDEVEPELEEMRNAAGLLSSIERG